MLEMKIADLIGPALDWAVAKAINLEEETLDPLTWVETAHPSGCYSFSTNWIQGGPLIERERIDVFSVRNGNGWCARSDVRVYNGYGPTPLIAAMRCLVASKLGDTVQIPSELIQ